MMPARNFLLVLCVVSCGGTSSASNHPGDSEEFQLRDTTAAGTAKGAQGVSPSKIKATDTHAAVKFFVVDKKKNEPIPGIVISLQDPKGNKFYTEETDAAGYGEVLVPIGAEYEIVYLSLGRKDVTAAVKIPKEPRHTMKLTLRYERDEPPVAPVAMKNPGKDAAKQPATPASSPVFRLDGVNFATNSADLPPESRKRLDSVVEYMTHKKSVRIEISGHTDNVGSAQKNKDLSMRRAESCRNYLVEQGIDGSRIDAVGYGDERPVASNDTDTGRAQNRRIEAREV